MSKYCKMAFKRKCEDYIKDQSEASSVSWYTFMYNKATLAQTEERPLDQKISHLTTINPFY